MNLLSIVAAYGVSRSSPRAAGPGSCRHRTATPVPPFIPVMMFAILFGLSMDYEVFLLSRVREECRPAARPACAVTAAWRVRPA